MTPRFSFSSFENHPNLGACPDFGHYPKSGINPVNALKKLSGHVISMHFKDVAEYNNTKVKDVTVGTGVINFPEVFEELKRQKYTGHIMIERDKQDKPNNLASINQTIKYYTETLKLPAFKTLPYESAGDKRAEAKPTGPNTLPKEIYYVGKWTVVLKGTPEGDMPISMTFEQKDGKWTGTYTDPKTKEELALNSIEAKENSLVLAFKFAGFDMTMNANRLDDEHFSGKMMEMIDVEGTRKKQ